MANLKTSTPKTEHNLATLSPAEQAIATFERNLSQWLDTPFVSPMALAENGTAVTITAASLRELADEETGEVTQAYAYLVKLQEPIEYRKQTGEIVSLNKDDRAIVSFDAKGPIRKARFEEYSDVLANYGPIENMKVQKRSPSAKAAAANKGPSADWVHASAWQPW
jgi:hypothetical protein